MSNNLIYTYSLVVTHQRISHCTSALMVLVMLCVYILYTRYRFLVSLELCVGWRLLRLGGTTFQSVNLPVHYLYL